MTGRPDDHVRSLLGAFVLDHLATDEATAVRAHLDGCASCREEAAALRSVADLLLLADLERMDAPPEPPPPDLLDEVIDRIEREQGTERRKRRRSLTLRAGVAALLAVAALVAAVAVATEPSSGETVAMATTLPGVQGEAVVHADPGATWVELTTSGLTPGETYAVWLQEQGTHERAPLGTFTAIAGDLYISLYSTLPRDRAGSIGVSAADGSTVMEAALPAIPA
jgi:anti-sigma factor RsiW